jgi:hypothetical protein
MKARVGRWIAACAACMVVVPAAADAALTWQRVADPAPGSTFDYDSLRGPTHVNFAVADGVPYLAVLSRPERDRFEAAVYRAVDRNTAWRQIDLGRDIHTLPSMAALDSSVWMTWIERDAQGVSQVRIGILSRRAFRELAPIAPGTSSDITVYRGRVYVSYTDASGELHTVRFNRARDRWQTASSPPTSDGVLVGRTLYTYTLTEPAPEAPNVFTLYATRRGVTEEAPNPTVAGNDVTDVHLTSSDGTLWMLWIEGGTGAMAPPRIVHVARLVRR